MFPMYSSFISQWKANKLVQPILFSHLFKFNNRHTNLIGLLVNDTHPYDIVSTYYMIVLLGWQTIQVPAHALVVLLLFFDLLVQMGQKMFAILLTYMIGLHNKYTSFGMLIPKCAL